MVDEILEATGGPYTDEVFQEHRARLQEQKEREEAEERERKRLEEVVQSR